MKKFIIFLEVVFSLIITLNFDLLGIHEFLNTNDTPKKAYLYINNDKSCIDTCKDIKNSSCLCLISKPKELALKKKKDDIYYQPKFSDIDFYLFCPDCAKKYFLNMVFENLYQDNSKDRVLCEQLFRSFSAFHAITCSHDCENCGKIFELHDCWLQPFHFINFISKCSNECARHAIEKFSIYKGYKTKGNHYKFYDVFVERFPIKPDKIKNLDLEFPIECCQT